MSVSAYILIQTEVGKAASVAQEVGAIDGVVSADDVTGPYDVIARAGPDRVIADAAMNEIRAVLGNQQVIAGIAIEHIVAVATGRLHDAPAVAAPPGIAVQQHETEIGRASCRERV